MADFFLELSTFVSALSVQEDVTRRSSAEDNVHKLELYLTVLSDVIETLQSDDDGVENQGLLWLLNGVVTDLQAILSRWLDIEMGIDPDSPHVGLKVEKENTGGRGRPKYVIKPEQLIYLRDLRFSWTKIASLYGVSRRTLYNIRFDLGLAGTAYDNFTPIADSDLQEIVRDIKTLMPEAGQNMVRGLLAARGVYVQIVRIRDCIRLVDPINTALRWALPRRRRVYSVPRPNSLWHVDGNHKLIRFVLGNFFIRCCLHTPCAQAQQGVCYVIHCDTIGGCREFPGGVPG